MHSEQYLDVFKYVINNHIMLCLVDKLCWVELINFVMIIYIIKLCSVEALCYVQLYNYVMFSCINMLCSVETSYYVQL